MIRQALLIEFLVFSEKTVKPDKADADSNSQYDKPNNKAFCKLAYLAFRLLCLFRSIINYRLFRAAGFELAEGFAGKGLFSGLAGLRSTAELPDCTVFPVF